MGRKIGAYLWLTQNECGEAGAVRKVEGIQDVLGDYRAATRKGGLLRPMDSTIGAKSLQGA